MLLVYYIFHTYENLSLQRFVADVLLCFIICGCQVCGRPFLRNFIFSNLCSSPKLSARLKKCSGDIARHVAHGDRKWFFFLLDYGLYILPLLNAIPELDSAKWPRNTWLRRDRYLFISLRGRNRKVYLSKICYNILCLLK